MINLKRIFAKPANTRDLAIKLSPSSGSNLVVVGPDSKQVFLTKDSALSISTYWACIRIISESIASLPRCAYVLNEDGSETADPTHYLSKILNNPSKYCDAVDFWGAMLFQVLHVGNAYAYINDDYSLQLLSMYQCVPVIEKGQLFYAIDGNKYLPSRVLHIKGLSLDGIVGLSPFNYHSSTLGIATALNQHSESFFSNGCQTQLVIYTPPGIPPEKLNEIKKQVSDNYTGTANSGKPMVWSSGFEVETLSFNPENSQLLESRKYSAIEICRLFRVPPHKVAELDRATFSNIEHQSIEFVQDTLVPWITKLEEQIANKLLLEEDKGRVYPCFDTDGLLRGDMASRYAAYKNSIGSWMTPNEIRRLEGQPPVEGGDVLHQPLNVTPIGPDAPPTEQPQTQPTPQPEPPAEPQRDSARSLQPVVDELVRSLATKEFKALSKGGDTDAFILSHSDLVREKLSPVVESLALVSKVEDKAKLLNNLANAYVSGLHARAKEGNFTNITEYVNKTVDGFKEVYNAHTI